LNILWSLVGVAAVERVAHLKPVAAVRAVF
jgi:hypothetical protein